MTDWKIFEGNRTPDARKIERLPAPPSWRPFGMTEAEAAERKKRRGATYQASEREIQSVNAALYLRRPLLVTGNPGTGKTSLAYAVAHELQLGEVLYWPITTRTTLKDGLYSYDAIGRLQDTQQAEQAAKLAQMKGPIPETFANPLANIGDYIQLGPLGTALLPSDKPRVLLIDEIDKSDIDLPNDLLYVLEEGRFEVPELVRIAEKLPSVRVRTAYNDKNEVATYADASFEIPEGRVDCTAFPVVIMTSNGERDFPPPFLRRCLQLEMDDPLEAKLRQIVSAHLGGEPKVAEEAEALITTFLAKKNKEVLATDQLLNAVFLLTQQQVGQDRDQLVELLLTSLASVTAL